MQLKTNAYYKMAYLQANIVDLSSQINRLKLLTTNSIYIGHWITPQHRIIEEKFQMMKGSMTAINQGAGTPENGILSPTLNKYRLRKHNEGDLASDRDKHRK